MMFFGRIKLGEVWPQDVGQQIVSACGDGILLDLIFNEPDFRPVILRSVPEEDDLKERLVGFDLDRVMELRNEGAQFFEEGNADLLEVLLGTARVGIAGISGAKVGDVAVESNGPGLRGDLPFGRAKKNAEVTCVNGGDTRGNGFRFERMIDGREHDGVVCDMDDDAAAGEVGDDFVFLGMAGSAGRECGQEN